MVRRGQRGGGVAYLDVLKFVEKPPYAQAVRFLSLKNCYWNSGIFVWQAEAFWRRLEQLLPEHAAGMRKLAGARGTPGEMALAERVYARLPAVSVDRGIMEKTGGICAVPGAFGWDDVGGWSSLGRFLKADRFGNSAIGRWVSRDCRNCIVYSPDRLTVTLGLTDLLVATTPEVTLVASREQLEQLQLVLEELRGLGLGEYL